MHRILKIKVVVLTTMKGRVLITGGAGFIGSHVADVLYKNGYKIRILDNLSKTTHDKEWPTYLKKEYELIKGDVRYKSHWIKSLKDVDYVIHLAAKMDLTTNFSEYADVNVVGLSNLYEVAVAKKLHIKKVILASTQFVYGQGTWECKKDGIVRPTERSESELKEKRWDPVCPVCGGAITLLKSKEEDIVNPPNQYAITKYASELIGLKLGKLYNIPTVALRYSIAHGARQSIKSLYSGALRQFVLQLLSSYEVEVHQDGQQLRDFISVKDVANAHLVVLETDKSNFEIFNVAGDEVLRVVDLVNLIGKVMHKKPKIIANGHYRLGSIRHAISDNTKLKNLGWKIKYTEKQNVIDFINWVKG